MKVALCFLMITALGLPALAGDYGLTITDFDASSGDEVAIIQIIVDNPEDIQGWHFGVCHDADVLSVDAKELGEAVESLDFTYVTFTDYDDGWALDALLDVGHGTQCWN